MVGTLDVFDTNVLVQVVPNLKVAQNFLLDEFFPNIVCADSEFVSIDVDIGKRRVAPFVSPLVEGKLVEQRRIQTNTFKPAYIKDKRVPDLLRPVRRQIGERIGGELKGEERMMANLMFEMADQVDMVNRRLELMAASALATGTLTVSGDGFPTTVIDYGRDAALTVSLSGVALWDSGNAAANPSGNIETWANLVLKKSGAVATDIIFSPTAYALFKRDPAVRDAIVLDTHNLRADTGNNARLSPMIKHGAQMMGRWGSFTLWVYNDWYVDDNNVEQRMLADSLVLVISRQMMGTRAFGQIMDPAFNYGPLSHMRPKSWLQEDPAQRFILMQSSPLVIPSRVNCVVAATVCTAVNT